MKQNKKLKHEMSTEEFNAYKESLITEAQLQKNCIRAFHYEYGNLLTFIHHSPNGGKDKNRNRTAKKLGTISGFPDLQIGYRGRMLYIELKRPKGGVIEKHQEEVHEWIKKCGFDSFFVKSEHDFMQKVATFIKKCDLEYAKNR